MVETANPVAASRPYVTFKLGVETYAINVMQVREILRAGEIVPVPGAPADCLGIINLRGNVVTVFDARRCFGLEELTHDDAQRTIIVEVAQEVCGIRVDSVTEVIEIAGTDIEPAPTVGGEEQARHIEGVVNRGQDLVILLSLDRLLSVEQGQFR